MLHSMRIITEGMTTADNLTTQPTNRFPFSTLDSLPVSPFFQRFSLNPALYRCFLFSKFHFRFPDMALKIRLQRHGASHRPFYRMVVTEAAARRDGRFVEVLGTYEPQAKRSEEELKLKLDRVDYWHSVGARPTDTAASLIRKARREAPAEPASAEA